MRIEILLLALLAAVGSVVAQHSRVIPPMYPSDPVHLSPGVNKTVLVVGATPSGLRAALELASRGYQVHVTDSRNWLGGDYGVKQFMVNGQLSWTLPRLEEGIYFNAFQTKDLLSNVHLNTKTGIKWTDTINLALQSKKNRLSFASSSRTSLFYLKLNAHAVETGCIGPIDMYNSYGLEGRLAAMSSTDMQQLANLSLQDMKTFFKAKDNFYECFLHPLAAGSGLAHNQIGAFEALHRMLYYISVDPNSPYHGHIAFNVTDEKTNLMSLLVKNLTSYGVTFSMGYQLQRFYVDGVKGLITGDYEKPNVVYDHIIMAGNVAETVAILNATKSLNTGYPKISEPIETALEKFANLADTPPIKVVHLLLSKTSTFTDEETVVVGYPNIERVTVLDQVSPQVALWCKTNRATLLQLVVRNCSDTDCNNATVWNTLKQQLLKLDPEFSQASVIHADVTNRRDAVNLATRQHSNRERVDYFVRLGITNLVLAGNWMAKSDYPADHLERDLSLGVEAANAVLLRDRIRQATMTVALEKGAGR